MALLFLVLVLVLFLVTYLINKNSVCKQSATWCVPLPCYLSLLVFRWIVKYRRCSGWKLRQTDRGKWSEHPITFRFLSHVCPDVKVIDIQSDLSRKRPRPVGDHFLKAKKISQSKLYSWGLLQTTTARKRPLPLWGVMVLLLLSIVCNLFKRPPDFCVSVLYLPCYSDYAKNV